jgi:hypothetical protein
MRIPAIILTYSLFLCALPTAATAETTRWGSVAVGCVPDSSSIYNARFVANATTGEVTLAPGKTGQVHLICRIRRPFWDEIGPTRLAVTYKDGADGLMCMNLDSSVTVAFLKTPTGTGSPTTITSFTAANSGLNRSEHVHSFTADSSAPNDSYYWVRVTIGRSNTSCDVRAYGVRLFNP